MNSSAAGSEFDAGLVDRANLGQIVARSAAAVGALQALTAVAGIRAQRRDYADLIWGPGLGLIAGVSAWTGRGDAPRRWGLALVSGGWAVRLGSLMWGRISTTDSEDPRYGEFLSDAGALEVAAKVFLTQGLAQLIVAAPIQLAAASRLPAGRRRWLAPLGLAVMVAGTIIEAVADAEKNAYTRMDRESRPVVLDSGLWGLSRHPNYFGDSVVWDGAWLAAAASPPALWTLGAPVIMNYLLIYATGAKRTERRMAERPGYRDYQNRVSFFFPWPKRA
jgi:steroid 5-alpha reductase family enzyme